MSKFDSVNNFIKAVKGEHSSTFVGYDGERFNDNMFFVDNTCICRVKDKVMFLPLNTITPKLSLYIRELTMQSNNIDVSIVYVPQWYSCDKRTHNFEENEIINAFTVVIDKLKDKKDIYSKNNLEEIKSILLAINSKCFKIPNTLLETVDNILEKMEIATRIENREVKKFIEENCYYDIVQAAYFSKDYDIVFKTALKQYLNPSGEYAFLNYNFEEDRWYSSESVCGIPKATMAGDDGWNLIHHYHNKTLRHGMKFGEFTIMKVMDNYLQISCNKYSKAMFEALHEMEWLLKGGAKV